MHPKCISSHILAALVASFLAAAASAQACSGDRDGDYNINGADFGPAPAA
jgi:hypothetical protein